MTDLMQQQDVLRGLSDASLNQEMSSPTVAPFLVLTEISRRKTARERYDGDKARRGQPTTVVEDLTGGVMAPAPALGPPPPAMAGAMPMPDAAAAMQGFAHGGLVNGYANGGLIDYDSLEKRLAGQLNKFDSKRDRSRALALMMAGAAMMGNGSSNFMKNLGAGVSVGAQAFAEGQNAVDDDESAAIRDALDFSRVRSADDLSRMQFDWQKQNDIAQTERTDRGLDIQEQSLVPSTIRETRDYMNMTPEERAAYEKLNPPPASMDRRLTELRVDVDRTFENHKKAMLDALKSANPGFDLLPPEDRSAKLSELEAQAFEAALNQLAALNPDPTAQAYIEMLRANGPPSPASTAAAPAGDDPLGIL